MPKKATNLAFVVYDASCREMVLLETLKPTQNFVSIQERSCWSQQHVDSSSVLVPRLVVIQGALFQEGIGNLVVHVLLMEDVLVREDQLKQQPLGCRAHGRKASGRQHGI